MVATHIEFVSDISATACPICSRSSARDVVLVNRHRMVLARGTSCAHCGLVRHRAAHGRRSVLPGNNIHVRVPSPA